MSWTDRLLLWLVASPFLSGQGTGGTGDGSAVHPGTLDHNLCNRVCLQQVHYLMTWWFGRSWGPPPPPPPGGVEQLKPLTQKTTGNGRSVQSALLLVCLDSGIAGPRMDEEVFMKSYRRTKLILLKP